jgi:hypothetical protein
LSSCTKNEGYGGTSSIKGKIHTSYYNEDYSILVKEEPAVDEDVFLIFGDNEDVGDKVVTSPNGSFRFDFLQAGSYTLYYMGEDSTSIERDEDVISIEIDLKSGTDFDLGELTELKTLDYNEGTGRIFGVVRLINYRNTSVYPFLVVKDTSFAQDHEVFIIYGDNEYFEDRIRTNYNGYFEFTNLIPGDYEIFTLSEDVSGGTEDIPISRIVTITEENQEIDLGVLTIEQL